MKSVFRSLQALNIEKANLDMKKKVRGGISASSAKTYTEAEKNARSLYAVTKSDTCKAC